MPMFRTKKNAFIFLIILWCHTAWADDREIVSITVLSERSLALPLTQLASEYTKKYHQSVNVAFAPSFEQTMAIQEGEPADLFISAHPQSFLQLHGALEENSITPLVSDNLVLVTSTDIPDTIDEVSIPILRELRKRKNFLLAVATPAAAEGYYAEQLLTYLRSYLFLSSQTVQMQNTADIVNFLKLMPAFGIMFESDALQSADLRVLGTFPASWYKKIVFTGAVTTGGNVKAARKFLRYLQSPSAQQTFITYGLYPETPKPKNEQSAPRS